ncbi:carboxypeptidase-like regulatory domain-containing protein [Candidatus Solirubrobacter pratensis]|uniref:carboxypeptidase-like regulatory domain-containing protein n=1 Tax=Candidatus Solirubrobacter pratensis TaxID=1298857 RepID=UPI000423C9A6|nr:carboxypeptidase-like regulatory domain-containing protein [Candidatus Solirubrobacter pratensis]
MWSCRGPDGSALDTGAWQPDGKVADSCPQGGSLRVSPDGAVRLAPPAGTRIAGYELWRSAADGRIPDDTKVIETVGTASYTASSGTVGDPTQPLSAANRVAAKRSPLDALSLKVACVDECEGARIDLYRSRVAIDDPVAPSATAAVAGDDAVIVNAADRGAGVASLTLSLDGGPAETVATGCAPPYTAPAPCPGEVARAFAIDAGDGLHSASGTVVDAAGNTTAWGPVAISIRRSPALLAPAPPAAAPAEKQVLELSRAAVEHAPGATARLTGTLRTVSGAPVAGARLAVTSFDLAADDAEPRTLSPVTTDTSGAFTVELRRDGAQRVTVASPAGAQATATVRTRLSLAVASSRGRLVKGRVLTLRGRLRGAGASARGAVVTIESIVNGAWQPVGAARTKADGSYRWSYRFVHLMRDTIFSFRAVVERGPGWPWASERSPRLKVRVDVP